MAEEPLSTGTSRPSPKLPFSQTNDGDQDVLSKIESIAWESMDAYSFLKEYWMSVYSYLQKGNAKVLELFDSTGIKYLPLHILVLKRVLKYYDKSPSAKQSYILTLKQNICKASAEEICSCLKSFSQKGDFEISQGKYAFESLQTAAYQLAKSSDFKNFKEQWIWVTLNYYIKKLTSAGRATDLSADCWGELVRKITEINEDMVQNIIKWIDLSSTLGLKHMSPDNLLHICKQVQNHDDLKCLRTILSDSATMEKMGIEADKLNDIISKTGSHIHAQWKKREKFKDPQTVIELADFTAFAFNLTKSKDAVTLLHPWCNCIVACLIGNMQDVSRVINSFPTIQHALKSEILMEYIKKQFSEDLVSHFGTMSFQDMAHLIFGEKNQLITYDVVLKYLNAFCLRREPIVLEESQDQGFKSFSVLILDIWPDDIRLHQKISDIIVKAAEQLDLKRKQTFLKYLFSIDIKLFATDDHDSSKEDFVKKLACKLQPKDFQCEIIEHFNTLWHSHMHKESIFENDWQLKLFVVICEVIILDTFPPFSKDLSDLIVGIINKIERDYCGKPCTVEKCVWRSDFQVDHINYWQLVEKLVMLIAFPQEPENPQWYITSKHVIDQLCRLYSAFLKVHESTEKRSTCISSQVKPFFEWIDRAKKAIKQWVEKFQGDNWSQIDLEEYKSSEESVKELTRNLHIHDHFSQVDSKMKERNLEKAKISVQDILFCTMKGRDSKIYLPSVLDCYFVLPQNIREILHKLNFKAEDYHTIPTEWFPRHTKLSDIRQASEHLKQFLSPLSKYLPMLLHFKMHRSQIFENMVKDRLPQKDKCEIQIFADSLSILFSFIQKIPQGSLTFKEMKRFKFDTILSDKMAGEVKIFELFDGYKIPTADFSQMELYNDIILYLEAVEKLVDVLQKHFPSLSGEECLQTIVEINRKYCRLNYLERTLSEAASDYHLLRKHTTLDTVQIQLFREVHKSSKSLIFFRTFDGGVSFQSHYEIVTQSLKHQEYEEVLDQVAGARKVLLPFIDQNQSLGNLFQAIKGLNLDPQVDFAALKTVNENIAFIQSCFSRVEGDTSETIHDLLNDLRASGTFLISKGALEVQYKCSRRVNQEHKEETVTTWNEEKITDFNRTLCLLKRKNEEDITMQQKFQFNFKTARKALLSWNSLKQLQFNFPACCILFACNASEASVMQTLEIFLDILKDWKEHLQDAKKHFKILHLFSTPKIFQIYSALRDQTPDLDALHNELLYILNPTYYDPEVVSNSTSRSRSESMQELDQKFSIDDLAKRAERDYFKMVGEFLMDISKMYSPCILSYIEASLKHHPKTIKTLYELPSEDQRSIIILLWKHLNQGSPRLPVAHELLWCSKGITSLEISSFCQRAANCASNGEVFLILNLELLSVRLQEILYKESQRISNISYVFCGSGRTMLHDIPGIIRKPLQDNDLQWSEAVVESGLKTFLNPKNSSYKIFQLVYGKAGNGKTFYIKQKLREAHIQETAVLCLDETFSRVSMIKKLRKLSTNSTKGLHLNFTIALTELNERAELKDELQRFLFDLFVIGYVEDASTGLSFSRPNEESLSVFIEVPSEDLSLLNSENHSLSHMDTMDSALMEFFKMFPVLELLGTPFQINPNMPLELQLNDKRLQLMFKYLKAYDLRGVEFVGINQLCFEKESRAHDQPAVSTRECQRLLTVCMTPNARINKIYQIIFISYMARRLQVLDKICFNQDTSNSSLGTHIMELFLEDIDDFLSPRRRGLGLWNAVPREQIIFRVEGDPPKRHYHFELVSTSPKEVSKFKDEKLHNLPVKKHSSLELESRDCLDKILADAFGIKTQRVQFGKEERDCLKVIVDKDYVLTLDFAVKMLEINERYESGMPVIIEGETGVGKTFLIEMLASLWNQSLIDRLIRMRLKLWLLMKKIIIKSPKPGLGKDETLQHFLAQAENELSRRAYNSSSQHSISRMCHKETSGGKKTLTDIVNEFITYIQHYGNVSDDIRIMIQDIRQYIEEHWLILFEFQVDGRRIKREELLFLIENFKKYNPEGPSLDHENYLAPLLTVILGEPQSRFFHKKTVHGGMSLNELEEFLYPLIQNAQLLKGDRGTGGPKIVVFFDEINTTSFPGVMKEILVDRTFTFSDKITEIPDNVFIIGACNPHRSHSVILQEDIKNADTWEWVKGYYYVQRLHPSLKCLMWNYGALDDWQEEKYIKLKFKLLTQSDASLETTRYHDMLCELITKSQKMLRTFSEDHYKSAKIFSDNECCEMSKNCVSQRDIQRVFIFYQWFTKIYHLFKKHGISEHSCSKESEDEIMIRAVLMSIALTYYFRLNNIYRKKFEEKLTVTGTSLTLRKAIQDELNFYIDMVKLPHGIAKTEALKENLFCIIACCCARVPLIIVGEPGSSKTLSFNLAASNLRGIESKSILFQKKELFPCFDVHYFQCSEQTSSKEVEIVFERAIKRQAKGTNDICTIVFLDEAGLPLEAFESLKILHKYLDNPEVSFVAITNHVLDAAKTNRAVTVFRSSVDVSGRETIKEDITQLAMGCYGYSEGDDSTKIVLKELSTLFYEIMRKESFKHFYGIRDFIHFIHYLRRRGKDGRKLDISDKNSGSHQEILRALERNFSGHLLFEEIIWKRFWKFVFRSKKICQTISVLPRNIYELLEESLNDKPSIARVSEEDELEEVRYKLIIDSSEDGSSRRLLMKYQLVDPQKAKTIALDAFPDDLQRVNAISDVLLAARQGQTVILMNTEEIHGSFYDLFNQHFRKISSKGKQGFKYHFYANVAIGSYSQPCKVDPNFQCIVIMQATKVRHCPSPFLNRFEKYQLNTELMLKASTDNIPESPLRNILEVAIGKVTELGTKQFGVDQDSGTIQSIFIDCLPIGQLDLNVLASKKDKTVKSNARILLREILSTVRELGFMIPDDDHLSVDISKMVEMEDFKSLELANQEETSLSGIINHLLGRPTRFPKAFPYQSVESLLTEWLKRHFLKKLLQIIPVKDFVLLEKERNFRKDLWITEEFIEQQQDSLFHVFHKARTPHQKLRGLRHQRSWRKTVIYTYSCPTDEEILNGFQKDDLKEKKAILETVTSDTSIQLIDEKVADFSVNESLEVMILIINLQEITKEVINHFRLRIDIESESEKTAASEKVFILILYSPIMVNFQKMYPAIFLYGWDFAYLDSITIEDTSLGIRFWLRNTYSSKLVMPSEELPSRVLERAADCITSRISPGICTRKGLGIEQRKSVFLKILRSDYGTELIRTFMGLWSSDGVLKMFLYDSIVSLHTSSSITEVLNRGFENLLGVYLSFMFVKICTGTDLSSCIDCAECVDFLIKLLPLVEKPKSLKEVQSKSHTWKELGVKNPREKLRKFPNFDTLSTQIDKTVRIAITTAVNEEYVSETGTDYLPGILRSIKNIDSQIFSTSLQALESPNMWRRYVEDYATVKFGSNDSRLVSGLYEIVCSSKTREEQVARLHVMPCLNQACLGIIQTTLRLSLQFLEDSDFHRTFKSIMTILSFDKSGNSNEEIGILLDIIYDTLKSCETATTLIRWFSTCQHLEENILISEVEKAMQKRKWNILFLFLKLLQGVESPDEAYCEILLHHLKQINESSDIKLCDTVKLWEKLTKSHKCPMLLRNIYDHFLTPHSPVYCFESQEFFIREINSFSLDALINGQPLSLSNVRYYFRNLLTEDSGSLTQDGVSTKLRKEVGKVLSERIKTLPSVYVPYFYLPDLVDVTDDFLKQTLAHVYFMTFFDILKERYPDHDQIDTMSLALEMKQISENSTEDEIRRETLVLLIERQVYIHHILQSFSETLKDTNIEKAKEQFKNLKSKHDSLLQYEYFLVVKHHSTDPQKLEQLQSVIQTPEVGVVDLQNFRKRYPLCWQPESLLEEIGCSFSGSDNSYHEALQFFFKNYQKYFIGLRLLLVGLNLCLHLKTQLETGMCDNDVTHLGLAEALEDCDLDVRDDIDELHYIFEKLNEDYDENINYSGTVSFFFPDSQLMSSESQISTSPMREVLLKFVQMHNKMLKKFHILEELKPSFTKDSSVSTVSTIDLFSKPLQKKWRDRFKTLADQSLTKIVSQGLPVFQEEWSANFGRDACITIYIKVLQGIPEIEFDLLEDLFILLHKRTQSLQVMQNKSDLDQQLARISETDQEALQGLNSCLKMNFHTIESQTLIDLIEVLRNIGHHLSQMENITLWRDRTLKEFLAEELPHNSLMSLFMMLRLRQPNKIKLDFLEDLSLKMLLPSLELFEYWYEVGFSNFSTCPIEVKVDLPLEIMKQLLLVQDPSSLAELYWHLDLQKIDFSGFESSSSDKSLREVLLKEHALSPQALRLLENVQCQHYVFFVLTLRKETQYHQRSQSEESIPNKNEHLDPLSSTPAYTEQAAHASFNQMSPIPFAESSVEYPDLSKEKCNMTSAEISTWLYSINMGEYASAFEKYNMDGQKLQEKLEDPDFLDELGITSNIKKKMLEVRFYGSQECNMTTDEVFQWLRLNGFEEYCTSFKENDIDGALLAEVVSNNLDYLKDLGIKSRDKRKSLKEKFIKHITL